MRTLGVIILATLLLIGGIYGWSIYSAHQLSKKKLAEMILISHYRSTQEYTKAEMLIRRRIARAEKQGDELGLGNSIFSLVELYMDQNRMDEALHLLEAKSSPDGNNQLGELYYWTGEYEKALNEFNKLPVQPKQRIAQLQLRLGQHDEAAVTIEDLQKEYERLLEQSYYDVETEDWHRQRYSKALALEGELYRLQQNFERSGELFEAALAQSDKLTSAGPETGIINLYYSFLLAETGEYEPAREQTLQASLKLQSLESLLVQRFSDPTSSFIVRRRVQDVGREHEILLKDLLAIWSDQSNAQNEKALTNYLLAHAQFHAGKYENEARSIESALPDLRRMYADDPEDLVLILKFYAEILLIIGDEEEAGTIEYETNEMQNSDSALPAATR